MVFDVCFVILLCGFVYVFLIDNFFGVGCCGLWSGFESVILEICVDVIDFEFGGELVSLVVVIGVLGMVFFFDSVIRMFGDLSIIEVCFELLSLLIEVDVVFWVCCIGIDDGVLYFFGWFLVGEDVLLMWLWV